MAQIKVELNLDIDEARMLYGVVGKMVSAVMKELGDEVEDWYLPQNKNALDLFRALAELDESIEEHLIALRKKS